MVPFGTLTTDLANIVKLAPARLGSDGNSLKCDLVVTTPMFELRV